MSYTTCSVTTSVITSLGTTPEERGLTTDEFKAKFDEFATNFVAWFNATHIAELDADKQRIGNNPSCRVYHSASQSISNNLLTALTFNSERFDNDTIHDNSTNPTRLTCKTAGKYFINAVAQFAANATGTRQLALRVNGATYITAPNQTAVAGGTDPTVVGVSTIYNLAENDYVEAMAKQTSGGALNIDSVGNYTPEFMMVRVG